MKTSSLIPLQRFARNSTLLVILGAAAFLLKSRNITTTQNYSRRSVRSASKSVPPFQEFPYPTTCQFEHPPPGLGTNYEIALFYHVGMVKNWENIVRDQLHTLQTCGLAFMTSSLTISYSNGHNNTDNLVEILNEFDFTHSLKISFIQAIAEPWEAEVMASIARTCQTHQGHGSDDKKLIVYYLHNKGCSRYTDDWQDRWEDFLSYSKVLYWRKYMEWFLFERPTLCLRAILNHGASTCGVNLHSVPSWHYSGNFWAASCDWIKTLPPTVVSTEYAAAEMWIGLEIPLLGPDDVNTIKHVSLFETGRKSLYVYQVLPDTYALNEAKTQGRYSSIWLDYFAGVEEGSKIG